MEILILFATMSVLGLLALFGILWYQHKHHKTTT
jgi:hypothetical protein